MYSVFVQMLCTDRLGIDFSVLECYRLIVLQYSSSQVFILYIVILMYQQSCRRLLQLHSSTYVDVHSSTIVHTKFSTTVINLLVHYKCTYDKFSRSTLVLARTSTKSSPFVPYDIIAVPAHLRTIVHTKFSTTVITTTTGSDENINNRNTRLLYLKTSRLRTIYLHTILQYIAHHSSIVSQGHGYDDEGCRGWPPLASCRHREQCHQWHYWD